MSRVLVSIGSNIEQVKHITACLDALSGHFGELALSSVYESEAVGFGGDNFYNLVAAFDTDLGVGALAALLRAIENDNGRRRDGPRFSSRTLDIDILTCDQRVGVIEGVELPRDEILHNAFVLLPLAELVPDTLHPVENRTYRELWRDYDRSRQSLWPIDFCWRGRQISFANRPQGDF